MTVEGLESVRKAIVGPTVRRILTCHGQESDHPREKADGGLARQKHGSRVDKIRWITNGSR